jgi:NADH-quinone oxidoreductase subunit N
LKQPLALRPCAWVRVPRVRLALAGLPPGLAGLFAKVTVIDSLLDGDALWLAIIVALNAVIVLAYYARLAAVLFREGRHRAPEEPAPTPWPVTLTLTAATVLGLILGLAPQLVLSLAGG